MDDAASDHQSTPSANVLTETAAVDTEQRLKRLLEIEEARSSADTIIRLRKSKRQRESRSRSVPPHAESRQERT